MSSFPQRKELEPQICKARNAVRRRPPLDAVEPVEAGEETVWRYPRPPRVESIDRVFEIMLGDRIVACSERALRVIETSSPEVIYVPNSDLRAATLVDTGEWALCEWKGVGTFFDLQVDDLVVSKAGWHYPKPFDDLAQGYERLVGHVALFPAKFVCCLDGIRATPQDGGYYGGWITPALRGPFKGAEGTEDW